jgi:oligosaccharide repeat unit polymerase
MTAVSWICFGLVLIILLSWLRKGSDLFSPFRVFGIVWTIAIGLADLKMSGFQHTWSLHSWLILLLGMASFVVGLWAVTVVYSDVPLLSISEIRRRLRENARSSIDGRRLYLTIIVIFLAYVVSYAAEIYIEGNVPLFSPRIEKARIEFGVFGLHFFVNGMLAIMFFCVEYLLLARGTGSRRSMVFLILFLTAGTFLLLLQRYNFMVWAIMSLGFVYYASRRLKFRHVLVTAVVFFALLMVIQSFRVSQYVQQYHFVISKMRYPASYAAFTEPYMYIVMNLENSPGQSTSLTNSTSGILRSTGSSRSSG